MAKKNLQTAIADNAKSSLDEFLRIKSEMAKKLIDEEIQNTLRDQQARKSDPAALWQGIGTRLGKIFGDLSGDLYKTEVTSNTDAAADLSDLSGEKVPQKPQLDLESPKKPLEDKEDDFDEPLDDRAMHKAPEDAFPDTDADSDDMDDTKDFPDDELKKPGLWDKITSLFSRKPEFDDTDDFDNLSKTETTALKKSNKEPLDEETVDIDDEAIAVVNSDQEKEATKPSSSGSLDLENISSSKDATSGNAFAKRKKSGDDSAFEVKL
jgi:hypothetical protein